MLQLQIEPKKIEQTNNSYKEKYIKNIFSENVENILTELKTDLATYKVYEDLVLKDNKLVRTFNTLLFVGITPVFVAYVDYYTNPHMTVVAALASIGIFVKYLIKDDNKIFKAKVENINEIKPKNILNIKNKTLWEKLENKRDAIIVNLHKLNDCGIFEDKLLLELLSENEKMVDFYKNIKLIQKEHEVISHYVNAKEPILTFEDFKQRENLKDKGITNKSFTSLKENIDDLYIVFKSIQLNIGKK